MGKQRINPEDERGEKRKMRVLSQGPIRGTD